MPGRRARRRPGGPPAPPVGEAVPDLRGGLGLLSRGLIAYGVIGLIVAVLGLALLLYANTRIDAAGDRVETSVAQLTTTLDATAQALHDASTTAATLQHDARPDADRGRRRGRHDRRRADEPPEPRERAPIGQHPRDIAARRRGERRRRDRQLDRGPRLASSPRSPTAWPPSRDSLAANADSLGALGDSIAATAERLRIRRRRGFARRRPRRDRAHAVRPDGLGGRPGDRRPRPRRLAAAPARGGRRAAAAGSPVRGGARPLAQLVPQGGSGGKQPAHPVDAAAGRCR